MDAPLPPPIIGVLALQGAFFAHQKTLRCLGVASRGVRRPADLVGIDGLIIPGGESTALLELIHFEGLYDGLKAYVSAHPCLGTCAGLILLASQVSPAQACFGRLPVTVERNAYGRQRNSLIRYSRWMLQSSEDTLLEMPLIRAPKISQWDPAVTVHAWLDQSPAFIQYGHTLGCTFHPELSDQTGIHAFFVALCRHHPAPEYRQLPTE